MRSSAWSADVCSSDRGRRPGPAERLGRRHRRIQIGAGAERHARLHLTGIGIEYIVAASRPAARKPGNVMVDGAHGLSSAMSCHAPLRRTNARSEEHTSELQSLMRIPYAVFILKKTK